MLLLGGLWLMVIWNENSQQSGQWEGEVNN